MFSRRLIELCITLALLLSLPGQPLAGWLEAPGSIKERFSKLFYNPESLKFDPNQNLDRIEVRFTIDPAAVNDLQTFLKQNQTCAAGIAKYGPCTQLQMPIEFDGIMRLRYLPGQCLNKTGQSICTFPELPEPNEWESVVFGSALYHIYHEQVLRPQRTGNRPVQGDH